MIRSSDELSFMCYRAFAAFPGHSPGPFFRKKPAYSASLLLFRNQSLCYTLYALSFIDAISQVTPIAPEKDEFW
jgi:hypothetical protein